MDLLGQGLVLMLAGMGIVYLFLVVLIATTKYSSAFVAKFDHILPQDAPKKAPKAAVANDDANIALAIAVAMG
jgi:sodium pump decarboxylase gamma subunit